MNQGDKIKMKYTPKKRRKSKRSTRKRRKSKRSIRRKRRSRRTRKTRRSTRKKRRTRKTGKGMEYFLKGLDGTEKMGSGWNPSDDYKYGGGDFRTAAWRDVKEELDNRNKVYMASQRISPKIEALQAMQARVERLKQ